MNEDILQLLTTGSIPYRYEPDVESLLYFALAVMAVVFAYALAQGFVRRLLK